MHQRQRLREMPVRARNLPLAHGYIAQADPTHSATKNPVRAKISSGPLGPVEPNPAASAITATNTCVIAVANNPRAIPSGRLLVMRLSSKSRDEIPSHTNYKQQ